VCIKINMSDKNSDNVDAYLEQQDVDKIPRFRNIMCPVLRLGVRNSKLVMDDEGWVDQVNLYNYMEYIGIDRNAIVIKKVIDAAKSRPDDDKINIAAFKGSVFDHGSTSGIFRYEVLDSATGESYSQDALDAFVAMSRDDENMDLEDFAQATNRFHQCPFGKIKTSIFGVVASTFEFVLLLQLFGRTHNGGTKFLTLDDVKGIWGESKFPRYWTKPQKSEFGTRDFIIRTLVHGWRRLDLKMTSYFKRNHTQAVEVRDDSKGEL